MAIGAVRAVDYPFRAVCETKEWVPCWDCGRVTVVVAGKSGTTQELLLAQMCDDESR